MIRTVLDFLFGRSLARQTAEYLDHLSTASVRSSRQQATGLLTSLAEQDERKVILGRTEWGETVSVPIAELTSGHGLITGGTGSGKTRFALGIIRALLMQSPPVGFGILDPKGDIFVGTLALLARRVKDLEASDTTLADEVRQRIVILDVPARDPVSPYNILAKGPHAELGYFAESRAELLLDLLPGGDAISLGGSAVLRRCIMLLSAAGMPATFIPTLLHDDGLRSRLVNTFGDREMRDYFAGQFAKMPSQTIAALSRRMDALFASDAVRMSLSGPTAPDFRALQDAGYIVLVNCFGENLSRGVRRLLQALVLSDIAQSIFARERRDRPFTWFCDEAQLLLGNERTRNHLTDIWTLSRSFGSFLTCLTQNVSSAVNDSTVLHTLHTNVRWTFSMRGDPSDAAFLKSALPITGQKVQPRANPLEQPRLYSPADERANELNGIAHLPDRLGFLWLKARSAEAIKIRTASVALPHESVADELRRDPTIGMRMSRKEQQRALAERQTAIKPETQPEPGNALADAYRRRRGGRS
jgi:hypothetical protein